MDLPTLIEACFNGLAKGGASALGSGLWVLTQRLICGLTSKFVTADDVSEADVFDRTIRSKSNDPKDGCI